MKRIFGSGRYANVTSTLALVVALGGTGAYAANTIRSSDIRTGAVRSSDIGNRQVKRADLADGAVTSAKVRNGTLLTRDFKRGQLGAAGLTGPRGPQGVPGPPGAPGATGATGPSDAFHAFNDDVSPPDLPAGVTTSLVSLPLPPGRYVIVAKTDFDVNPDNDLRTTVECRLKAGGATDRMIATAEQGPGGYNCHGQLVYEFGESGTAIFEMSTPNESHVRVGDAKVTAIRVGSIAVTEVDR